MLNIPIKLLTEDAKVPTKKNFVDAGWDLYANEDMWVRPDEIATVKTGVAMSIPRGHVGLIWDRSGLSAKEGLHRVAGVIDCGYHGEIMVAITGLTKKPYFVNKGDRIAQMVIQKIPLHVSWEVVDSLEETTRGEDGFGSSGK